MKTSEQIDKILPDLFKAKSEMKALSKDANNPYFSSKYTDLNTVLEGVEPLLNKYNMLLLQPVNGSSVESMILHISGQFVSSEMTMVLGKNTMQEAGSAVSYARRYTLVSLLSLKQVDDDANLSSGLVKDFAKPAFAPKAEKKVEEPKTAPKQELPKETASSPKPVSNGTAGPAKVAGFKPKVPTAKADASGGWT